MSSWSKRVIGLGAAAALAMGAAASWAGQEQSIAALDADQQALLAKVDFGKPYLAGPLPGALELVPPPPSAGSLAEARDLAANAEALALIGKPRWERATRDADLSKGALARDFSCPAGVTLSDATTPAITHLLRRAGTDLGWSTSEVKDHYQRPRPFMENGRTSCTPADEPSLRKNGSYPSGHSALGYGTGLILATIFPDRAAALVRRGREFGDSRRVCNVHWLSDVEAGRDIAAATVSRLEANAEFATDLAAARAEAADLPDSARHPADCAEEAAALNGAANDD